MLRSTFTLSLLASACLSSAYAATTIELDSQPANILTQSQGKGSFTEVRRDMDRNHNTHIRLQQMYQGIPVFAGDIIVHIPQGDNTFLAKALVNRKTHLSGYFYQGLDKDLIVSPAKYQDAGRKQRALEATKRDFQQKNHLLAENPAHVENTQLVVYVDEKQKAHYAYLISFLVKPAKGVPTKPTFVMDAETFDVYLQWDDIQTMDDARGGGFGGNKKMGKFVYDGLSNDYPTLKITRELKECYLKNVDVTIKDARHNDTVMAYNCEKTDSDHNNVYWDADFDAVNGAYSPANDALYIGQTVKEMYQKWYGVPVLESTGGEPMMLNMRVHEDMENAYWDGQQMTFGDGGSTFYPLVSLGVGAHEISHGFTQQHGNMVYVGQPGGINESFSDMAAQAAEYFSTGTNSWKIGSEIAKDDIALRYMDEPTKDCDNRVPGDKCSISNAKDFHFGLNVHYSSGVFNKAFYLIATAPEWNVRKAFDVMVEANRFYWTRASNFKNAACGVLKAAKALNYSTETIKNAFEEVGVQIGVCK